jgi:hypothetical protein
VTANKFVSSGRNRIFNLLIKSRLETNSLSNQAFAKNQARTEALDEVAKKLAKAHIGAKRMARLWHR